MSSAALLLLALLLDAVLGEPDWLWRRVPHPVVVFGRVIGILDTSLNTGGAKRLRGVLCVAGLIVLATVVGAGLARLGPTVEVVVAAMLLAQRSLVDHVAAVSRGLSKSLPDGRAAVAMIVSRDTTGLDETAVARAAIESGAENFSDGVVAPAFWFLVAGLPGIVVYKMVNTADSMIGYRTPRYEAFGWAAARTDDLLNLIPARLSAGLLAVVGRAWDLHGIIEDARRHRSPNAGWPEAALSRGLGVALAGPRSYDGRVQDFNWVNAEGRKSLSAVDIDAGCTMIWQAWGVLLALLVPLVFFT